MKKLLAVLLVSGLVVGVAFAVGEAPKKVTGVVKSFEPVNVEKHKPGKIVVKVGDKEMTFMADPATEIDAGVKPGVRVEVAYSQAEDVLVAESVKIAK